MLSNLWNVATMSKKWLCVRRYRTCILYMIFISTTCVLWISHCRSRNPNITGKHLPPTEKYTNQKKLPFIGNVSYSRRSVPPCESDVFLVCIVHSAPRHFLYRKTIRKTWGSLSPMERDIKIRLIFVVGRTDRRVQYKLVHEMQTYNDVVQGDFLDSYKNLTYKHLTGYQWILGECASTTYVMKADDDIFVDTFRVVSFLRQTFGSTPIGSLLACLIVPEGSDARRSGKWTVTRDEYPDSTYREYCSGMAYFTTPDTIRRMMSAIDGSSFLWVDDVFVTGVLASSAKVRRTDLGVWYARHEYLILKWLSSNSTFACPWMISELSPRNWPDNVLSLWQKTVRSWNKKENVLN